MQIRCPFVFSLSRAGHLRIWQFLSPKRDVTCQSAAVQTALIISVTPGRRTQSLNKPLFAGLIARPHISIQTVERKVVTAVTNRRSSHDLAS